MAGKEKFVFEVCYEPKREDRRQRLIGKQGHCKMFSTSAKIQADSEHEARRALIYELLERHWVVYIRRADLEVG